MNPLRTVGGRLSLALAVVVLGALAIVWVALVPTLQHRLVAGRLAELATSMTRPSSAIRSSVSGCGGVAARRRSARTRLRNSRIENGLVM